MKKHILYIILLLAMLYGCESDIAKKTDLFLPDFEVFVLLPHEGLGDQSFVDIAYEGIEKGLDNINFRVQYTIPNNLEEGLDWIKNIKNLQHTLDKEALIIIIGVQHAATVEDMQGDFGNNKVLLIDGSASDQENLACIEYHSFASSYIGGYLSAKLHPNMSAAVVAGFDTYFLDEYIEGFKLGVMDAGGIILPTQYVSDGFSGFEMPDSAYKLTTSLLPTHQLIFALSSGSNFGIINAVRDYSEQRYVVGIDADQSWMGLTVVSGSIVKLLDADIYEYIEEFADGHFENGSFMRTLADEKIKFLCNDYILNSELITEELIAIALNKEDAYLR